jgi:hypothetical protein
LTVIPFLKIAYFSEKAERMLLSNRALMF